MRILIGTMMAETNTFTPNRSTLEAFRPLYGKDLFEQTYWHNSSTEGVVRTLQAEGVDIIPTFYGFASAGGTIEFAAYQEMKWAILEGVRKAGQLDGICMILHGSMFVDGEDDPEGDLMTAIREIVGPELPIVCPLDMHATLTDRVIASVNAFTVYRTAPHVDEFETGVRAVKLLLKIVREKLTVMTVSVKIPVIISGEHSQTATHPMKEIIDLVRKTDHSPAIMNADVVLGFPWADTPHHCVRSLACGDASNREVLKQTALRLAQAFWDRRHKFTYSTEAYPLERALDVALAEPKGPVIISDTGDNPTAGASADNALVLKRLLERKVNHALVAAFLDPSAYEICRIAGPGAVVELPLGRVEPTPGAPPFRIRAEVLRVKTAADIEKKFSHSIGAAVLQVDGVTIIVAELPFRSFLVYTPAFLEEMELKPSDYKIIVLKVGYQSPLYQAIAHRSLFALTPGETNIDLLTIPYCKAPRPIYPLDKTMTWEPQLPVEA